MAGIAPVGRPGQAVAAAVRAELGSRRGIGAGAFVLALVTAGALAHVGVRMKGIEVAYDLGHERRINTQLEEERRRLNIEIEMLKDPVRVVGIARDKLKMGPPAAADIVRLAAGQAGSLLGERPEAPPARGKRSEHAVVAKPARRAPVAAKHAEAEPDQAAPAEGAPSEGAPVEKAAFVSPAAREADE